MADKPDFRRHDRETLIAALEQAHDLLEKQKDWIGKVQSAPAGVSTVHAVMDAHVLLLTGNGLVRIEKPADIRVEPGQQVVCNTESMQIIDVIDFAATGTTETVARIVSDDIVAVGGDEGERLVFKGRDPLEEGDVVILDRSGSVVLEKVKKPRKAVRPASRVTFNDIGGLRETKAQIREAIEYPLTNPELYAFYGKKPPSGILLYGSPGCGKTMIGKAIATTVSDIFIAQGASDEAAQSAFIYVKSTELLNKFVGQSEANIRAVFNRAKKHKAKYGFPAVVFIDEADAVMGRRGDSAGNPLDHTVVPAFLTEMDGLEDKSAIVVLATNRPDTLDPAIIRDGRIDAKIRVQRPDEAAFADIMAIALKNCPLQKGLKTEALALNLAMNFFSPRRVLTALKIKGRTIEVPFSALASGAIAVGLVEAGIAIALRRDLEAKTKKGAKEEDFIQAIDNALAANAALPNTDAVNEYLTDLMSEPKLLAAAE